MRGKAKRLTTEDTGEHRGKFVQSKSKAPPCREMRDEDGAPS